MFLHEPGGSTDDGRRMIEVKLATVLMEAVPKGHARVM